MQPKLWISIVSEVYVSRGPVRQVPLNAKLLWPAPNGISGSGHCVATTIPLKALIGTKVDGYRLESDVPDKPLSW